MPIKELPSDLRPREKALKEGIFKLNNIELLAILLRSGTKNFDVLNLSKKLWTTFGSFAGILIAPLEELKKINGIGTIKALEIKTIFEIFKRFKKSQDIFFQEFSFINKLISITPTNNQEIFTVLLLDRKKRILHYQNMFFGVEDEVQVDAKAIVALALKWEANSIICFHNHPSGNVEPSKMDYIVTNRIANYCEIMNINFTKHIIYNSEGQYKVIKI